MAIVQMQGGCGVCVSVRLLNKFTHIPYVQRAQRNVHVSLYWRK